VIKRSKSGLGQNEIFREMNVPGREEMMQTNVKYLKDDEMKNTLTVMTVDDCTVERGPTNNFGCEFCPYRSKSNYNLKRHVMAVHEGVTYPCQYCTYNATQTHHLKSHIASVHRQYL